VKVVFRVDASLAIGSGHVMRCLSLAGELKRRGADVKFVSREFPGNMCTFVEEKGYRLYRLPYQEGQFGQDEARPAYIAQSGEDWGQDAEETVSCLGAGSEDVDWLIVDHYALDSRWESALRSNAGKVMVIDDLANRSHDCNVLFDQNLHSEPKARYLRLVGSGCVFLLGPEYALLRPEFIVERRTCVRRSGHIRRIFVFFGGSDISNETIKTIEAIEMIDITGIEVDIVAGVSNIHKETIRKRCEFIENMHFHCPAEDIAELMANADIAIAAGGSTTWERCCVGLPALTISVADHQEVISKGVEKAGASIHLGMADAMSTNQIADAIKQLMHSPKTLMRMEASAKAIVDGLGTKRVASVLFAATDIHQVQCHEHSFSRA